MKNYDPIQNYNTQKDDMMFCNNIKTVIIEYKIVSNYKNIQEFVSELKNSGTKVVLCCENEISNYLCFLEMFPNIIIKFGRFIPHSSPRFDEILGIELQSDNQYAKVIS